MIEVSKCSLADVEDFTELAKEHWNSFQNKKPTFDINLLSNFYVVRATDNDKTVGYILYILYKSFYYDEICCQVDMFYLKPEYRKQGIGKKMFTLVEEDAKQRGATQLISSFNLKQPLEGFYQKMGFETTHVAVAKEI
jgi:GNAT superfamily N-acetyltransferase